MSVTITATDYTPSATLDSWMKDLLGHTPGAVRSIVQRELLSAAREFYSKTFAWYTVLTGYDQTSGEGTYVFTPSDENTDVIRVLDVAVSGVPISRLASKPFAADQGSTQPSGFFSTDANKIVLRPTPTSTVTAALAFRVALCPKRSATRLPDIALAQHYDAILDGTLGRLLIHPSKPYTNAVAADYHLKRFRAAIGEFSAVAKTGGVNAQAWRFPSFGK